MWSDASGCSRIHCADGLTCCHTCVLFVVPYGFCNWLCIAMLVCEVKTSCLAILVWADGHFLVVEGTYLSLKPNRVPTALVIFMAIVSWLIWQKRYILESNCLQLGGPKIHAIHLGMRRKVHWNQHRSKWHCPVDTSAQWLAMVLPTLWEKRLSSSTLGRIEEKLLQELLFPIGLIRVHLWTSQGCIHGGNLATAHGFGSKSCAIAPSGRI